MDKATRSTSGAGMKPSQLSSYVVPQDSASDEQIKNRSCLPGYTNQRSSTSNLPNTKSALTSMSRANHREADTIQKDEIFMMDHLAINPSASIPTHSTLIANDNHDIYRNHFDTRNCSDLLSSRGNSTPHRRSRNAMSSISRSATAALAKPGSSSTSRVRNGTHHKNLHVTSQQYSNSTASTGSRNNHPSGATTSASPSKRSSSRISFSSQLSSTTTAPSIHDIDDIGTVSSRRSENSSNHQYFSNHHKHPSPRTGSNAAAVRTAKPSGKNFSSGQSIGSTTTKSSSGTNTMGNTEAMSKRRNTQKSALSPTHKIRANDSIQTNAATSLSSSSALMSHKLTLDVDTMKQHVHETRRIIDGK